MCFLHSQKSIKTGGQVFRISAPCRAEALAKGVGFRISAAAALIASFMAKGSPSPAAAALGRSPHSAPEFLLHIGGGRLYEENIGPVGG
jgi:hypothetical protein